MARRKTPSVDFATRFLLCLACRQGLGREFVPYLNLLCALARVARVDWVYDCDKYVQIYQEEPAFPMQDSFGRGIICYVFKKIAPSCPRRCFAFWAAPLLFVLLPFGGEGRGGLRTASWDVTSTKFDRTQFRRVDPRTNTV